LKKRREQVREKKAKQASDNEKNKEKSRKEQAKAAMALQEKIQDENIKAAVVAKKESR